MTVLVTRCTIYDKTSKMATTNRVLIARFLASLSMHMVVEKDITHSLKLMKYVVNHHDNFVSPYPAFFFGLLSFLIALHIEVNAMLLFTSMTDIVGIVINYFVLTTIVGIPSIYIASLEDSYG